MSTLVLTIVPPDPEFVLAPSKWRVQTADVLDDKTEAVGSRFFPDLRTAMLYVYRQRCPFRLLDWHGRVVEEGKSLPVETARAWIEQQDRLFRPNVEEVLDPELYPYRVATLEVQTDKNGRVWRWLLWHRDDTCGAIVKSRVQEVSMDASVCRSDYWPCNRCLVIEGDVDAVEDGD